MTPRTHLTYAVSAATTVALALAGCSEGADESTATPTGTSSPSPSTTASSAPPSASASAPASPTASPSAPIDIPAAARANTDAGAIAFGRHFITELDRAYVTTASAPIEAMSSPTCGGCRAVVTAIKGMKGDGVRQARPAVTLAGAEFVPIEGSPSVDVFASYASVPRVDAQGSEVTPGRAEKVAYRLNVEWDGQSWKVMETDVLN